MYPSYENLFYSNSPYGNNVYDFSNLQSNDYLDIAAHNERLFGPGFPSQGGSMGPPPPGPPSGRPPFTPPGQSPTAGPPTAPPPAYIPSQTQQVGVFAVDPGAIRDCLYRYTYVWLTNRQQFWFYPTFVGRRSIAGYRWTGFRWVYFGIDLRRIQSFQCV